MRQPKGDVTVREPVQVKTDMFHPAVVSLLRMRAEQQPRQIAYAFAPESGPEQEVTYSELDRQARAIACMLAELGAQGQPALQLYSPGLDYIAAFFGWPGTRPRWAPLEPGTGWHDTTRQPASEMARASKGV